MEERSQLYQDRFDMIQTDFENQLEQISHRLEMFDKTVSMSEYTGEDKPFKDMMAARQESITLLESEVSELEAQLELAVNNGDIEVGSESWYEMKDAIASAREEAEDARIELAKLYKDAFDDVQKKYENQIGMLNSALDALDTRVSASEYTGAAKPFDEMLVKRRENVRLLNEETAALEQSLAEAVASGKIKEGSDAWYEMQDAIHSARNEAAEAALEVTQVYVDAFDEINRQFDNLINDIDTGMQALERKLDMLEARGYMGGASVYQRLIQGENDKITTNLERRAELQAQLDTAMADQVNGIAVGSQAWYDLNQQIDECTASIEESEIAIVNYQNSIRQIKWDVFDFIEARIAGITDEADFLIKLLEKSDLFDENGQFAEAGTATIGLHAQNYDVYMRQADDYAKEAQRINKELADDPANTELIKRREELIKLQRDSILAAEDEKQAIADLVEEGIQKQLDHLQELIDKYTDLLDREKDAYDYQKNIAKQTKEIASLQKQLSAYSGDTSEENRARMQKLQVSLKDSMDQLAETQYDQFISDTKRLLDDLYAETEKTLNQRLDNIDALFEQMVNQSNDNTDLIRGTIETEADKVGATLSDSIKAIWSVDGTGTQAVSTYISGVNSTIEHATSRVTNILTVIERDLTAAMAKSENAVTKALSDENNGVAEAIATNPTQEAPANITVEVAREEEPHVQERFEPKAKGTMRQIIDEHGEKQWVIVTNDTFVGGKPVSLMDFTETLDRRYNLTENDIAQYLRDQFTNPVTRGAENSRSGVNVGGITVNIPIDQVDDYNDFVRKLRNDNTFEQMIRSITIDPLTGKSTLAKKKYYQ